MIIKNKKCIPSNKQFTTNKEILDFYKKNMKMNIQVICQKYISNNNNHLSCLSI